MMNFGTEAASGQEIFKAVAVITGRFALPQSENVGEADKQRHERHEERDGQRRVHDDEQNKEQRDARADAANEPPEKTAFQAPGAAFGVGRGVGIGQAKFVFGVHASVKRRMGTGTPFQKVPTPTALLESRPKIL